MNKTTFTKVKSWMVMTLIATGAFAASVPPATHTIMQPDWATRKQWTASALSSRRATLDARLPQTYLPSLSLLSYLDYIPAERNQGWCGNCWAWAGTGIMEVDLAVHNGIRDRLSVQYINSCMNDAIGKPFCTGGWAEDVAEFYSSPGHQGAFPWSNSNAYWSSGYATLPVTCGMISNTPYYPIQHIEAQTIPTHEVGQAAAIANIKNLLNQNKAVFYGFFMGQNSRWQEFFDFWDYQPENALWSPDPDDGQSWTSGGGGHAVLCVGYDCASANTNEHCWIMVNSWGANTNRPTGLFRVKMYINYDNLMVYYGEPDYNLWWQTLDLKYNVAATNLYQVLRSEVSDPTTAVAISGLLNDTSFEDMNAAPWKTYYYWVRTHNSNGWSSWTGPQTGWSAPLFDVTPSGVATCSGFAGGPFEPSNIYYCVGNGGDAELPWAASCDVNWLYPSATGGLLSAGSSTSLFANLHTSNAAALPPGEYYGHLMVSNRTSGKAIERMVVLFARPALTDLYTFNMDVNPGWNSEGGWAFGAPRGGGSFNHDPTSGYTGANVYGYNLNGDYVNAMLEKVLSTTPLDFSHCAFLELNFQRWLGVEDAEYDHASLDCNVGGRKFTLWNHTGKAIADTNWQNVTYALPEIAAGDSNVVIGWVMGETDVSLTYPGWNIDDVVIRGNRTKTLTISSLYGGSWLPVGTYSKPQGMNLTCTLTNSLVEGARTQMFCVGWSGTGSAPSSGAGTGVTFVLDQDSTLSWRWNTNIYFSMTAGPYGSVSGSEDGWYALGEAVVAWALPDDHCRFAGWQGVPVSLTNVNPLLLNLDQASDIVAVFEQDRPMLMIQSPYGSPLPAVGMWTNDYDAILTNRVDGPTTQGTTQFVCTGWGMSGNEPSSGVTNWMVMTHTNHAALNWLWRTNFYFSRLSASNGTVIGSSSGWYAMGSPVAISATASAGYGFAGWSGDISAGQIDSNPLMLTLDRPRAVQANFIRMAVYTNTIAEMTAYITNQMALNGIVGLSIALVDDQRVVWTNGFGFADRSNGIPATAGTVYQLASVTKTFTAAAVMQLVGEGLIALDGPLTHYVPQLKMKERFTNHVMTVRSVLHHHAGIPGDVFNGSSTVAPWPSYVDWLIGYLNQTYPTFPTNYVFSYSNGGYDLLAPAVTNASGLSFKDYTESRLFQRMGMTNTSYFFDKPYLSNHIAVSYLNGAPAPQEFDNGLGSGSMYSTADDMARYLQMLFAGGDAPGGRVLATNALEEMFRPQNTNIVLDEQALTWGLGWGLYNSPLSYAGKFAGHGGDDMYAHARVELLLDHKLGVFVACQTAEGGAAIADIAVRTLQKALADKTGLVPPPPYVPPYAPVTAWPQGSIDALAGLYVTEIGYDRFLSHPDCLEWISGADTESPAVITNLAPRTNGWFSTPDSQAIQLEFKDVAGQFVVLKHMVYQDSDVTLRLGVRYTPASIPAAWSNRFGGYSIADLNPLSLMLVVPPEYRTFLTLDLTEKDGLLLVGWGGAHFVVEPQEDALGFTAGLGRGKGEAVRIVITNGNERIGFNGGLYRRDPPCITEATYSNDQLRLTIMNLKAWTTNRVERSEDLLNPAGWYPRHQFVPTMSGSTTNWSDPMEIDRAYYRVMDW